MSAEPRWNVQAAHAMGGAVKARPQDLFYCHLEDQPTFLVPAHLLNSLSAPDERELIVNPCCWWSSLGAPPLEVAAALPLLDRFEHGPESIWVADPATRSLCPFSADDFYRSLLADMRRGVLPPQAIGEQARDVLSLASILVGPAAERRRREQWDLTLSRCAESFSTRGLAALRGLIHPFQIGALRRYYRYLIRKGSIPLGDGQSPRRYAVHNESVARFFHHQLTWVVNRIARGPVKPSYVYLASYQSGADLPKHTDRPQCEYSITLLIDYSPEPVIESPWPLHLETASGRVSIYQAIGDGLVYRGRAIAHYRDPLPSGAVSTSLFFHYVDESFQGSLD